MRVGSMGHVSAITGIIFLLVLLSSYHEDDFLDFAAKVEFGSISWPIHQYVCVVLNFIHAVLPQGIYKKIVVISGILDQNQLVSSVH